MARQYHHNEQGASDITCVSNVTWVDAVELIFTPDASTSYYLFFSGLIGNSVTSSDVQYQVLEGANVIASGNWEPKDTAPQEYYPFAGFLRHTEGGSPSSRTFKIQIKLETSGPTCRIRGAKLLAVRHETGDLFEETTAAFTTASASGSTIESLDITALDLTVDSYLTFGCAKLKAGTASANIIITLDRPVIFDDFFSYAYAEYSDTSSAVHRMVGSHIAAHANQQNSDSDLTLATTTPAGTTAVSDRRILALKVTGDNVFSNYDSTGGNNSTTSYTNEVTYSPTIATTGDHFVFLGVPFDGAGSTTSSAYTDVTIAGTVIAEAVKEFGGSTDTLCHVGNVSLVAGSNTINARAKGESAFIVNVFEVSFVVWQLQPPAAAPPPFARNPMQHMLVR